MTMTGSTMLGKPASVVTVRPRPGLRGPFVVGCDGPEPHARLGRVGLTLPVSAAPVPAASLPFVPALPSVHYWLLTHPFVQRAC